jgi:hypothetical protein
LPSFPRPLPELEHCHPPCPRCKVVRPVSSTGRHATPPVWEPPLPPPRPHGELRLPKFFHPNFCRSSLPLHLLVLQAPATTSVDHRISSPTPRMPLSHATSATPPSRRRLGASPPIPPCPTFSPFSRVSYPDQCLRTLSPGWIHRNVQKLQTKFHWNPLEQPYTVGLTKFIFVQ